MGKAPELPEHVTGYRFSAFWLRSSVVSVLISLISDTSPIRGPYIKLIFGPRRWNLGLALSTSRIDLILQYLQERCTATLRSKVMSSLLSISLFFPFSSPVSFHTVVIYVQMQSVSK